MRPQAVSGKASPELLRVLDLIGGIMTIDAPGCQRDMATTIVAQGADDVLALKGNQGTLHADVQLCLATAQATTSYEVKMHLP